MTMYSDLSAYNEPVSHSNKQTKKNKSSSHFKRAPSLGSLEGKTTSDKTNNSNHITLDQQLSNGESIAHSELDNYERDSSKVEVVMVKIASESDSSKDDIMMAAKVDNKSITVMAETAQVEVVRDTTAENDKDATTLDTVVSESVEAQSSTDNVKEKLSTEQTQNESEFMSIT